MLERVKNKNNTVWLVQQTPTAVITIYSDRAECTFQKLNPPPPTVVKKLCWVLLLEAG